MYAEERHEAIAGLVRAHGRVAVSEVATTFGVTTETVRRDLASSSAPACCAACTAAPSPPAPSRSPSRRLADRDVAARRAEGPHRPRRPRARPRHGRQRPARRRHHHRPARRPAADRPRPARRHPRRAARRPPRRLPRHRAAGRRRPVRGSTQAAVGADTVQALADLRADVVFVGTNALRPGYGLTTPNAEEAAVKRALVRAGRQVVVLTDSSKIGRSTWSASPTLDDVDVLVTDDGIAADDRPRAARTTASRSWSRDRHPHRQPEPGPHGHPARARCRAARCSAR